MSFEYPKVLDRLELICNPFNTFRNPIYIPINSINDLLRICQHYDSDTNCNTYPKNPS